MNETELQRMDQALADRYGVYASFSTAAGPVRTDAHGDPPAQEVDRLLDLLAIPGRRVLDLGCGAGQTLCRLAPRVAEIWGIDCERPLLEGARTRVQSLGVSNARLVSGDTTDPQAVAQLPDNHFDLAFSRRGPFLNQMLVPKLTPNAQFILELCQDCLGLGEIFGRKAFLPGGGRGGDWAVDHHAPLGFVPASVKSYFYDEYFRDADHLAAYLSTGQWLSNWWMPPRPYDPVTDRPALELYARYNRTRHGVRLTQHRKVYLFYRTRTGYYPADGEA